MHFVSSCSNLHMHSLQIFFNKCPKDIKHLSLVPLSNTLSPLLPKVTVNTSTCSRAEETQQGELSF